MKLGLALCCAGLLHANLRAEIACAAPLSAKALTEAREKMVEIEVAGPGVKDARVLDSMRATARHEFVSPKYRSQAYFDMALPIGDGQTISPPFVVAYMTEQLAAGPEDTVLEIGTGSGYQAAVLSPLCKEVYSIEIVKPLGEQAARTLKRLHYKNVFTKIGDGFQGWPEHAPFDRIIVTCSPDQPPPKLVEQLREGGKMIVPVGERYKQTLYSFEKRDGKLQSALLLPTLFVPMTGKAEEARAVKPNAAEPAINNGGFEERLELRPAEKSAAGQGGAAVPAAWHYLRQGELVEDRKSPEGERYMRFTNEVAGRRSAALQGMAIDGRKVNRIQLSAWVKVEGVRPGDSNDQQPVVGVTFYDDRRAEASGSWLGPWRGTSDWARYSQTIDVPATAREAIVRIGLHGATGVACFDNVELTRVKK